MSRLLIFVILAALPTVAAILPDQFNGAPKSDIKAVQVPDKALFEEFGFEDAEQARYGPTTLTVWRFRDPTGALAGYQFLRPEGSPFQSGNYVLQFAGKTPTKEQLVPLFAGFAKYDVSALPVISTYLPDTDRIPNSERFIIGPVALERLMPKIPPSVAAFSLSAEAQYGQYRTKNGDMGLAIFNYPTPEVARERVAEFLKISGVLAKRAGPLVGVVPDVKDPDAAERLLAKVTYQVSLTMHEATPNQQAKGFARAILAMFELAGLIIGLALLSGLAFALIRISKRGRASTGEEMITLHIADQK